MEGKEEESCGLERPLLPTLLSLTRPLLLCSPSSFASGKEGTMEMGKRAKAAALLLSRSVQLASWTGWPCI